MAYTILAMSLGLIKFIILNTAPSFLQFCGNPQFLFALEKSALGFTTSVKKNPQTYFFYVIKITVLCNVFVKTKCRLNSPAQGKLLKKWRPNSSAQEEQE